MSKRYFVSESSLFILSEDGSVQEAKESTYKPRAEFLPSAKELAGKAHKVKKVKGQRRCGICGEAGHRREKCPKAFNGGEEKSSSTTAMGAQANAPFTQEKESELVAEVRRMFTEPTVSSLTICDELGITLSQLSYLTNKYNITRG